MNIHAATSAFEQWVGEQTRLVQSDLRYKHEAMKDDLFMFLRATYYRWPSYFETLGPVITEAPVIVAVGDLHIENFGTWRDSLGRLAWGINDFDEAYPLPYTHDLVRLAVSAVLAIQEGHLGLRSKDACRSILDGYWEGLEAGGRAFVIGEEHRWFKPLLESPSRDPERFWNRLRALPRERAVLPKGARVAIVRLLPDPDLPFVLHHRIAGMGNLGKPRYTALAAWNGGPIAREAKALTLSAAAWASKANDGPYYRKILSGAIRSADPYLTVHGDWVTRRLATDCRRIELDELSTVDEEEWLLYAMGFETANVHLGGASEGSRKKILRHLADQKKGWLKKSAQEMLVLLMRDFKAW